MEGGRVPRLLRLATYNRYKHVSWDNELPESFDEEMEENDAFTILATRELKPDEPFYMLREEMTKQDLLKPLPAFRLRGAIRPEDPIPLPGDTATLQHF